MSRNCQTFPYTGGSELYEYTARSDGGNRLDWLGLGCSVQLQPVKPSQTYVLFDWTGTGSQLAPSVPSRLVAAQLAQPNRVSVVFHFNVRTFVVIQFKVLSVQKVRTLFYIINLPFLPLIKKITKKRIIMNL